MESLVGAGELITAEEIAEKVKTVILPAYGYFKSRIFGMLAEDVIIYKTMRYANPISMIRFRANFDTADMVKSIENLKHFPQDVIDEILTDLPQYLQYVSEIPQNYCENDEMIYADEFWKHNRLMLPGFVKLARYAFTMVTSSASSERAFSVLKRCFKSEQRLALEDYVSLSCMLQINRKNDN